MNLEAWEQAARSTHVERTPERAVQACVVAAFRVLFTLLLTLPLLAQTTPKAQATRVLEGMEQFISGQMQNWRVSGLVIAVIQDGQVIYSHGFGLRDVKNNLPVTSRTIFAIGSISKSFTAASMGILNDQGKLDWDKPVRQYIPEFQVHDPVASERMTPRDLISHRVGMAGHDLVWYSSDFSREDLVRRLRFLESDHDFRSRFQYNNLLVTTAGYMVGRISGQSWEDFVRQQILTPLGMTSTNFSVLDNQRSPDFSYPYRKDEKTGAISPIPFHALEAIAPAGAINSNVEDMARYAIFQLGNGKVGDRQIVSEANLNLNHTPQVPMPSGMPSKEIGPSSYGMGWVISSYRGRPLWWHNGGIDGFYALLSLLPDDHFGVVILTNVFGSNRVPEIVSYRLYDQMLGLEPVDWAKRFHDLEDKQKAADEEEHKKDLTSRRPDTHLSHDVRAYAGRYENAGYGVLTVETDSQGLHAALNNLRFSLEHVDYDVFESPPDSTGAVDIGKLRFLTDLEGDISAIAAPLEDNAPEIVFTRVAEKTSGNREPR